MGLKLCKSNGGEYFGAKISEGYIISSAKVSRKSYIRMKIIEYVPMNCECQNFLLPNFTNMKFSGYENLPLIKLAIAKLPEQSNRINIIQVRLKLSAEGETLCGRISELRIPPDDGTKQPITAVEKGICFSIRRSQ